MNWVLARRVLWFAGCVAVALTLSSESRATSPTAAELTVVVVRAGTLDWAEARRSVEAELVATGYEVRTRESAATTPGKLIDELRSVASDASKVRGSVAVFREGGEGRAYVWIPERENLFQVNAPVDGEPLPAQILSLRIVELLRVRLLDEPPAPTPPAQPVRGLRAAWAGVGPWLNSGLERPIVQFNLTASLRVADAMEFDLGGGLSAVPGRSTSPVGTVSVSASALSAHGLWLAHESPSFELAIGGGGGALVIDANASGAGQYTGHRATATLLLLSARARALYRLQGLALLLTLEPGVTLPELDASVDSAEVFHFGQPLFSASLGVGWCR